MGEVFGAQRADAARLRDEGEITDEVRRRVEYDLDLEEARLEQPERRGQRSATSRLWVARPIMPALVVQRGVGEPDAVGLGVGDRVQARPTRPPAGGAEPPTGRC